MSRKRNEDVLQEAKFEGLMTGFAAVRFHMKPDGTVEIEPARLLDDHQNSRDEILRAGEEQRRSRLT